VKSCSAARFLSASELATGFSVEIASQGWWDLHAAKGQWRVPAAVHFSSWKPCTVRRNCVRNWFPGTRRAGAPWKLQELCALAGKPGLRKERANCCTTQPRALVAPSPTRRLRSSIACPTALNSDGESGIGALTPSHHTRLRSHGSQGCRRDRCRSRRPGRDLDPLVLPRLELRML